MSTGTMMFNPFTGKPRDPRDIASDPKGAAIWDGEEPLLAARESDPFEDFKASVVRMLATDSDEALRTLTGAFVGLLTETTRRAGHNPELQIAVDSRGGRDITLWPGERPGPMTLREMYEVLTEARRYAREHFENPDVALIRHVEKRCGVTE